MMEISRIILDYVKVILGWPVIILILVLIFIKRFYGPMCDFFRRLTKAEAYGVRVEATQQKELKEGGDKLSIKTEDELRAYIKEKPDEVIELCLRLISSFHFEKTYNLIYGTQIDLLEHLQQQGSAGEKYINLAIYYNEFVKRSV